MGLFLKLSETFRAQVGATDIIKDKQTLARLKGETLKKVTDSGIALSGPQLALRVARLRRHYAARNEAGKLEQFNVLAQGIVMAAQQVTRDVNTNTVRSPP